MRKLSPAADQPKLLPRGRLLLLIGLGALTWIALILLFGGQAALAAIAGANGWWLLLAVLVHYSSFAVRGHRWQHLLAMMGHRIGYLYTSGLLVAGWFVSALLPARAGDFMRIGMLRLDRTRHSPVPVADSLGSIVLERSLDILAIVGLGLFFGWTVIALQAPGWLVASYAAAVGLLVVVAGAALLTPAVVGWLRRWSQRQWWQALLNFAEQLTTSLRALLRKPRSAALVIGESLYIWLCDALVVWFVLRSLNAALPFEIAAFVALTVDVLAAAPITPGGVGQIDAAYVAIFALLPAALLPAALLPTASLAGAAFNVGAAVLLIRFITYWSFLGFSGLVTVFAGFGELIQRVRSDGRAVEAIAPTASRGASVHHAPVQPSSDASS
jgi:uncharacterized protein (TIRG00374 family)